MNPIQQYYQRYITIRTDKGIVADEGIISYLIETDPAGLNNFFMAALGMSTVILRFGAVIQMCRKLDALDDSGDALFVKQVLENLRESLPSDTSWKNLWAMAADHEDWLAPTIKPKNGDSLFNRLITFRNRFVHQFIKLEPSFTQQLKSSILIFEEMAELVKLFDDGDLRLVDGKFYWAQNKVELILYPFVQPGEMGSDPYIFQGLYNNKSEAHLLNLRLGDEHKQKAADHIDQTFEPIQQSVKGGAGQVFDHSERIAYYQSCFVGRDREKSAILNFCLGSDTQNMLCVKSPAGMGKGALLADVIEQLKKDKSQVLFHFCGAGLQNSLHAVLYHFILQGKRAQYWETDDEQIQNKLERLPSKYTDVIHLFQAMLSENLKIQKNNSSGNLVVLIDGLDEAQVGYSQLKISDWFYQYNEKEEPENDWRSAENIRWIFSYRCAENGEEQFYRFPNFKETANLDIVQPLQGLSIQAVDEAFKDLHVSEEFKTELIKKAAISV